jgi:hypothetical protein
MPELQVSCVKPGRLTSMSWILSKHAWPCSRIFVSLLAGCLTGIAGVTGYRGFGVYLLAHAVVSGRPGRDTNARQANRLETSSHPAGPLLTFCLCQCRHDAGPTGPCRLTPQAGDGRGDAVCAMKGALQSAICANTLDATIMIQTRLPHYSLTCPSLAFTPASSLVLLQLNLALVLKAGLRPKRYFGSW